MAHIALTVKLNYSIISGKMKIEQVKNLNHMKCVTYTKKQA